MPYEDIQVITQIASLALFMGIMVVAYLYAFRRSNKEKFAEASAMPLRDDAPPADGDKQ